MIEAQVPSGSGGAILYDAACGAVPGDAWFDRDARAGSAKVELRDGGRGQIAFVDTPAGVCALRHYRRGGWAARLSTDRYLWTGAGRTRAFREFRLLARLVEAGLPVSKPVAARFSRHGAGYRADLLTRRIAQADTLAERLGSGRLDAALAVRVGRTLARFHAAHVFHADLNAHNIMVDDRETVWLIDFDRGRLRTPKVAWQQANIARLRRSLVKLGASRAADFEQRFWHPMLAAYHDGLSGRAVEGAAAGSTT